MKTILYLGSDPSHFLGEGNLIHYPVIQMIPRSKESLEVQQAFAGFSTYTHIIFTSKNAVKIFYEFFTHFKLRLSDFNRKCIIAIGGITADFLSKRGSPPKLIAKEETQEGIISLLENLKLDGAYFFLPRSSRSRPALTEYLIKRQLPHRTCAIYDTLFQKLLPVPDLSTIDEIFFTSPSTVEAFFKIYGHIPNGKKIISIGPITQKTIDIFLNALYPDQANYERCLIENCTKREMDL